MGPRHAAGEYAHREAMAAVELGRDPHTALQMAAASEALVAAREMSWAEPEEQRVPPRQQGVSHANAQPNPQPCSPEAAQSVRGSAGHIADAGSRLGSLHLGSDTAAHREGVTLSGHRTRQADA